MTITSYTALHLIEICEDKKKDSEFIILFNESEQNYYVYGTRKQIQNSDYKLIYEYVYHYSRLNSLISFIRIATSKLNKLNNYEKSNKYETKYVFEINNINICDCELSYLNFNYLLEKFNTHNEIVAYENELLSKKKLKRIIKILTSSY
jgi:hypothetical protein